MIKLRQLIILFIYTVSIMWCTLHVTAKTIGYSEDLFDESDYEHRKNCLVYCLSYEKLEPHEYIKRYKQAMNRYLPET